MLLWLLRGVYVMLLLGVAAFMASVFISEDTDTASLNAIPQDRSTPPPAAVGNVVPAPADFTLEARPLVTRH